jgi:Flp pilus assembly protein TadD
MKRLLVTAFCLLAAAFAALAQEPATPPSAAPDEFGRAVYFAKKFADLKDYAAAYEQFAKADALQPDQPGVLYNMGVLLARAGRYSEAQAKVDRYNKLFPAGAEKPLVTNLQFELDFQRELQKKRQADADYTELFTRGRFLYGKNDLEGARKLFEEAEQKRPADAAPIFNEGVIYEKQGDFAHAAERFHRYEDFLNDADEKAAVDQRLLLLESEMEDMKTKIVCPFCGLRLAIGTTWCHRCWHGPYLANSATWNSRPCVDGASATRATYYADDRFARNETLPCLWNGTMLDALRYTPAKQKAIQQARKSEGWTYTGDVIQGLGDQARYVQGADYLEKIVAPAGGEILQFAAHKGGAGWLLDREDSIIDGQKYTSHYTFDAQNRIARQQIEYQNAAACGHLISMTADYGYGGDALTAVKIQGGYDGFAAEGSPRVDWSAIIACTFDAASRVAKEELAVTMMTKTYTAKPIGATREELSRVYPNMRVRKPLENAQRGDYCATAGTLLLGNAIDLRPFYAISPNLAMQLPFGVTKASVTFTYPDSFLVKQPPR